MTSRPARILSLVFTCVCFGQTREIQIGSSEILLERNPASVQSGKIRVVLPDSDYLLGVIVQSEQTEAITASEMLQRPTRFGIKRLGEVIAMRKEAFVVSTTEEVRIAHAPESGSVMLLTLKLASSRQIELEVGGRMILSMPVTESVVIRNSAILNKPFSHHALLVPLAYATPNVDPQESATRNLRLRLEQSPRFEPAVGISARLVLIVATVVSPDGRVLSAKTVMGDPAVGSAIERTLSLTKFREEPSGKPVSARLGFVVEPSGRIISPFDPNVVN